MSIALLVISLPDTEDINDIDVDYELWSNSRNESVDVEVEAKLIPLPHLTDHEQAEDMRAKHSSMYDLNNTKNALVRFIDGWESALDEIEGKKR